MNKPFCIGRSAIFISGHNHYFFFCTDLFFSIAPYAISFVPHYTVSYSVFLFFHSFHPCFYDCFHYRCVSFSSSVCAINSFFFLFFFFKRFSYIDFGKFPDTPHELGVHPYEHERIIYFKAPTLWVFGSLRGPREIFLKRDKFRSDSCKDRRDEHIIPEILCSITRGRLPLKFT